MLYVADTGDIIGTCDSLQGCCQQSISRSPKGTSLISETEKTLLPFGHHFVAKKGGKPGPSSQSATMGAGP